MNRKELHTNRLRDDLKRLRAFRESGVTPNEPDFQSWKGRVHRTLVELFGPHQYVTQFANLHFRSPRVRVWTGRGRNTMSDEWLGIDQERYDKDAIIAEQLLVDVLDEMDIPALTDLSQPDDQLVSNTRKVFVVHGHDELAKQSVARFLEKNGVEAIILHEQVSRGRTLIEKLEQHSDVGFAVVLLTPDDTGASKSSPSEVSDRARQNVVLELGFFMGKLGRGRVCALHKGHLELPGDIGGVVYVKMDVGAAWQVELARELDAAGITIKSPKTI